MRRGANVIYQGRLEDDSGRWSGYPDFLLRVDRPSAVGGWSYEVLDTKLARRAKGEALLQLLLYSDLLAQAQGIEPELMYLALGGAGSENPASFRVAEYAAYYRAVRRRFEAHAAFPPDTYPEPVEHCGICEWQQSYNASWALDPASEKRAFERFIDNVMARWEQHPDFHIYHYGAYETTAVKRLMSRYATREEEVDRLLRGRVVRRPPPRGPAGVARLGRELLDQEAGAVLRLRSRGGPDHGDASAHSGRGAARVGRRGRCPGAASDRDPEQGVAGESRPARRSGRVRRLRGGQPATGGVSTCSDASRRASEPRRLHRTRQASSPGKISLPKAKPRWPPSGGSPRGSTARCSLCRGHRAAARPTPEPG